MKINKIANIDIINKKDYKKNRLLMINEIIK